LNDNLQQIVEERTQKILELYDTSSRYLSDGILKHLLKSPDALALGGKKRFITILMSDIRGFTLHTEKMRVEDVVVMLNNYLAIMVDVIHKYDGTVIEFIGDGILAVFGAPFDDEMQADHALACAIEMQMAMEKVNIWNTENGFPHIEMGIGLNTGETIAGNIGSRRLMKYNVIGSNVNLASRIETLTTGEQVLISEHTLKALTTKVSVVQSITFHPKGMPEPISVHHIDAIEEPFNLSIKEPPQILIELSQPAALSCYKITDKQIESQVIHCFITSLSDKVAFITGTDALGVFDNIKLRLDSTGTEVFAKVTGPSARFSRSSVKKEGGSAPPSEKNYIIRFTAGEKEFIAQAKKL
jgi:adenylate cyclase